MKRVNEMDTATTITIKRITKQNLDKYKERHMGLNPMII